MAHHAPRPEPAQIMRHLARVLSPQDLAGQLAGSQCLAGHDEVLHTKSDAADGLTVPGSTDCDGNRLISVRNRTLVWALRADRRGDVFGRCRSAARVRIVMKIG